MSEAQCYHCGRPVTLGVDDKHCSGCSELLLLSRGSLVYRVNAILGRGGFGKVYKAEIGSPLHRPCAIKSIKEELPDLNGAVIANEVRLLSSQGNRLGFIPDIYDYWQDGATHYIAMQFIEGETLDELYAHWSWPVSNVVDFLQRMLRNLEALHNTGIVHRDIKPNNIKYNPERGYVLLDFGLAGITGKKTEIKARTPDFAPPEQFHYDRRPDSRTDERTDLYSLAATAFFLLAGSPPRRALEWRDAAEPQPIAFPQGLPESLCAVLDCMLRLNPDERPENAKAALELLDASRKEIFEQATEYKRQLGAVTAAPGSEKPIFLPGTYRDDQVAVAPTSLDARFGHITDIAVAPDGRELAVATTRGVARYELPTGALSFFKESKRTIQQLAYIGGDDVSLMLVDEDGLWREELPPAKWGWYSRYDGRRIATVPGSNWLIEISQSDIVLREVDPPRQLASLREDGISAAALAPDGNSFAVAVGAHVRLYRIGAGGIELARTLSVATSRVVAMQFSGDGRLAVAGEELVELWRAADGRFLTAISDFPSPLSDLVFSPDGELLAVAAGCVAVFSSHSGQRQLKLPGDAVFQVRFSDGALLIGAAHGGLSAWSLPHGDQRFSHTTYLEAIQALALAPDGKLLALLNGRLHLWALHRDRLQHGVELGGYDPEPKGLAFSPDGSLVAAGTSSAITLWDVHSKQPRDQIEHGLAQTHGLMFAEAGRVLLYVGADGIRRYTVGAPEQTRLVELPAGYVDYNVAFARDGALIAVFGSLAAGAPAAGRRRSLAPVYRVDLIDADGTPCGHLSPGGRVLDVAIGLNNTRLVLLTEQAIEVWAIEPQLRRLKEIGVRANLVVLAPRSPKLALAKGAQLAVLDPEAQSLKEPAWLTEHNEPISDVVFCSDGDSFISASSDGTLRLWRKQP